MPVNHVSTLPKPKTVDRTLLWTVLARFGIPPTKHTITRQLHDGMRTCVRLGDGKRSGMVDVD